MTPRVCGCGHDAETHYAQRGNCLAETPTEVWACDCHEYVPAAVSECPIPTMPDRFGVVWPDGHVADTTDGARLFGQGLEERARLIASKSGGTPVRIVTRLEPLP